MYGLEWDDPLRIRSWRELINWINEIGFLPLFKNEIEGFSVEEHTFGPFWWRKMMLDMELKNVTVNTQSSIRIAGEKIVYFDPLKLEGNPQDADVFKERVSDDIQVVTKITGE